MGLKKKWTNVTFDIELRKHLPGWKRIGAVENAAKGVAVLCIKGHKRKISPSKIKTHENNCLECIQYEKRKEACEDFIEKLEQEAYKPQFDFTNYEKAGSPLPVICPNGSAWKVSRSAYVGKQQVRCRCGTCVNTINPKKKPVIRKPKEAAAELLDLGFEINPDHWKGIKTAIEGKWINCGHFEIKKPDKLIFRHERCGKCRSHSNKNKLKAYQRELNFIIKNKKQLENLKTKQKIDIICPNNHEDTLWVQHLFKYDIQDFKNNNAFICKVCKSEYFRGENNVFYIHGKSIENFEGRTDALYKRWYRSIKRTHRTCEVCRKKPVDVAHHLFGFNEYENVRYTPENGVALCNDCHDLFHEKFNYGSNTINQFELFLQQLPVTDTKQLQEKLKNIKPKLVEEIKKKKVSRKKVYSISKLALLVNEYPEIIRILVINGKINGAFQDHDKMWVISQEEANEFLVKSKEERNELLTNCLVGKEYGNLTITSIVGRKSEGKQLRLFVEVLCKCGEITIKPYYRLDRGQAYSCSRTCKIIKEKRKKKKES